MNLLVDDNKQSIRPAIRLAAMNLLAMREHSLQELRKKLTTRFEASDLMDEVLEKLASEGLQSDERFAEAFVRMRFTQGKGPRRIMIELSDRGVSGPTAQNALNGQGLNWFDLCRTVQQKRVGASFVADQKERARQIRFLQYRGFNSEQIQYALQTIPDE